MTSSFFNRTGRMGALLIILAILLLQAGCTAAPAAPPATAVPPAATALPTAAPTSAPTATARPAPTHTPTPDKTAAAGTAQDATRQAYNERVTRQLEALGLKPALGRLAWYEDGPTAVKVTTYQEDRVRVVQPEKYRNFVLQTEVKWNTATGFAGCGLVFRAGGDDKDSPAYRLQVLRLQYAPAWDIELFRHGEWAATLTGEPLFSKAIKDYQDSKNVLTLVVYDNKITTFINGESQGTVEDESLAEGLIGYLAFQESGKTTCTFSHSWIWVLDGPNPAGSL